MKLPENLKYAKTHEWARIDPEGVISVGITDHAQQALGDIVFLDLPKIGAEVKSTTACAVVESVKAAADIYAPASGTVVAINSAAVDSPEIVNRDAFDSWLFRIQPTNLSELNVLLDAADYAAQTIEP